MFSVSVPIFGPDLCSRLSSTSVRDEGQDQQFHMLPHTLSSLDGAQCLASGAAVETNPTAKCGSQKLLMFRWSSNSQHHVPVFSSHARVLTSFDSQGPFATKVDSLRCVGGCFCHSFICVTLSYGVCAHVFLWFSGFSTNFVSTLRGSYGKCKGRCLIRVLQLLQSIVI